MRRLLEPAPALVPRAVGNAPIGMVLPESLQQCPTLLGDKIGLNLMQRSTLQHDSRWPSLINPVLLNYVFRVRMQLVPFNGSVPTGSMFQ